MRQNNMRFFVAALFCMLFVLTGCGGQTQKTAAERAPGFVNAMTPEERADAILARMTPAEKIGQLLMIGVHGTELNADSRFVLSEYAVGGVILFDRNLETAAGVRAFTKELQEARHGDLPLFIAIDEEGGLVARMKDILPPPPAQSEIGAGGVSRRLRQFMRSLCERSFFVSLPKRSRLNNGRTRGESFLSTKIYRYCSTGSSSRRT